MRRIGPGHWAVQAKLPTVGINPAPYRRRVAAFAGHIDGLAVTVTPGSVLSPMQGIACARLEAGSDALAIIIAERAEHAPADAGGVHRPTGMIELLAEVRVPSRR